MMMPPPRPRRCRATTLTALLLAAVALAPVAAQDGALPDLDSAQALEHPRARGALRGATVLLAVRPGRVEHQATRCVHYLARLLERSGAAVAVFDSRSEAGALRAHAERAGATLGMELGWRTAGSGRVQVCRGSAQGSAGEAAADLADRLVGRDVAARAPDDSAHDISPAVPWLRFVAAGADAPRAHRAPVHALFHAVVAWWTEHGAAVRAAAPEPAATPARTAGVDPLWPREQPAQTRAEIAAFLRNWRRSGVVDASQVWLDVTVVPASDDAGWELRGSTELPLLGRALRRALQRVGVEPLHGALRLLPDAERLGGPAFGFVSARAAQTWSHPGLATGLRALDPGGQFEQTDLLRGEPVWLLDRAGAHLLVHAASGYLGWVRAADVERCPEDVFHARLEAGDASRGTHAARHALARLGTPYLFGGRSADGIDCSGLVMTAWAAADGVFVPRDARQQILAGRLVATARQPAALAPGDLLFFASGSGRISHVGMSLGGFRFVHATPPEVTVGSLDPDDPLYTTTAERFVLAKRPAR